MGCPVLQMRPRQDGSPLPELGAAGHLSRRRAESGGEPFTLLTRRSPVLQVVQDHRAWGMGQLAPSGDLRGGLCPVTGAEVQSPDGGLLSMDRDDANPERDHRAARRRIAHLFTPEAAAARRDRDQTVIRDAVSWLAGHQVIDLAADLADWVIPWLICRSLGLPLSDWPVIERASGVAFSPVHGTDLSAVLAGWDDIYAFYRHVLTARLPEYGVVAGVAFAMRDKTPAWVAHLLANVSNGYPAALQAIRRALWESATSRRGDVARCLAGQMTWASLAASLLNTVALYPIDLLRVLKADQAEIDGRVFTRGDRVLPSLAGAAADPGHARPPGNIAFSYGPHNCPGGNLTRQWLALTLEEFWAAYPAAELDDANVTWAGDSLSAPARIMVRLGG